MTQGNGRTRALAAAGVAVLAMACAAGTAAAAPARIAFDAHTGHNEEQQFVSLFSMRPDGTGLRQITKSDYDTHPSWAPHRGRLVFVESGFLIGNTLETVNANGSHRRSLDDTIGAYDPDWSPAGNLIVFAQSDFTAHNTKPAIYTMHANGRHKHRITPYGDDYSGPAFSHDGKHIAYEHHGDIYVMRSNGSHRHKLIQDGGAPNWAPDDQRIAFQRGRNVYVALADGSDVRRLTGGTRAGKHPAWSPDGSTIVFDGAGGGIWTMDREGEHAAQITATGRNPDW